MMLGRMKSKGGRMLQGQVMMWSRRKLQGQTRKPPPLHPPLETVSAEALQPFGCCSSTGPQPELHRPRSSSSPV